MQESKNNLKEHPDLYQRSIKGGYWVFAIRLATQFFGFIKSIIVFNILFETNLELIFVANLFIAALTTFTESGIHAALVQKKEDIESYLDTAWVIDIVRGILLFIVIYFAAPVFASYKVDPEKASLAVAVIRAMGLCFIIRALHNIGIVYFQKELQFHKTFWLTMGGTLTDIVLSISLLLIYRNVWAVVAAQLISAGVNLILSYLLCTYRPRFHFVPQKARELWKFGKWLLGGNMISYLLNEGDDWFVLLFFQDPLPFKLYRGAYRFTQMPRNYITNTISQVSFPAYSKIQHDLPRLCSAHLKVLQLTALISIPIAFLIFALGPDFVRLVLVEESHGMIPIVQILAFVGLITSLGASFGSLYRAIGKPHIGLYLVSARLILLVILIYPFTATWGIIGTAVCVLAIRVLAFPPSFVLGCKMLRCSPGLIAKPLSCSFVAAGLMCLAVMFSKGFLLTDSFINAVSGLSVLPKVFYLILVFSGLTLFSAVIYLSILWLLDSMFKLGYRAIIIEQINMAKHGVRRIQKRRF